ncbi:MAG TPA: AI-2E family transporter [Thermoleophilaceae bacterium]|nr:AI-2E family transporter [Thermoleophilaceae bacterium]
MPSTRAIVKVLLITAATAAVLYVLYLVRSILEMLFISVFLAVALGPAVDLYQRRVRMPRSLAIVLVYITILGAIVGLGLLVVPPIVNGVNNFVGKVPQYVQDLRRNQTVRKYDNKYHITRRLDQEAKKLPGRLGTAASALTSVTVGVFSALFQLVTVLVLTFFFLLDGKRMVGWGLRQLPPERAQRVRKVMDDVYEATSGYVVGNLIISVIAGTGTWIVLEILKVPFAVPLAVLMAFLDLIPLVGATIGGVGIGIVAAISNFPTALIVWAIYFIVYQQIENNILQPVIYRRTVALHPLVVLVAVLIGGSQLGVLGALLAIPVAAGVQIIVKDLWNARRGRIAVETGPPPPASDVAPEVP